MTEQQAREMAELRRSLSGRSITVELLADDGGNRHVRVPAGQEAACREAMEEWTKTRVSFFFKRQPPLCPVTILVGWKW